MQSLKDLTLTVSTKKAMLKFFFKQGNMSIISFKHVWKKWYIHDLLEVIYYNMKFQLNQTWT